MSRAGGAVVGADEPGGIPVRRAPAVLGQPGGEDPDGRRRTNVAENSEGLTGGATRVVDLTGRLRLAPRRSEHDACARSYWGGRAPSATVTAHCRDLEPVDRLLPRRHLRQGGGGDDPTSRDDPPERVWPRSSSDVVRDAHSSTSRRRPGSSAFSATPICLQRGPCRPAVR